MYICKNSPKKVKPRGSKKAVPAAIDEGVIGSAIGMRTILIPSSFSSRPWSATLGLMTNDRRVKGRGRAFGQLADTTFCISQGNCVGAPKQAHAGNDGPGSGTRGQTKSTPMNETHRVT